MQIDIILISTYFSPQERTVFLMAQAELQSSNGYLFSTLYFTAIVFLWLYSALTQKRHFNYCRFFNHLTLLLTLASTLPLLPPATFHHSGNPAAKLHNTHFPFLPPHISPLPSPPFSCQKESWVLFRRCHSSNEILRTAPGSRVSKSM